MQNVSVGKVVAVIVAIVLGVGAGLLAGFGLLPLAGGFFTGFIAVFAALSVAAIVLLFVHYSCSCDSCTTAYRLLCRDRVFLSVAAAGALIASLFASALFSAAALLNILFAVAFGLAVFFFVLLLLGWLVYASGFCARACSCKSCECESVPVR